MPKLVSSAECDGVGAPVAHRDADGPPGALPTTVWAPAGGSDAVLYHQRAHAACVLHDMDALIADWAAVVMSPMQRFAALFAAIVHDVDHQGFNNSFHHEVQTPLDLLYNGRSALESHHASLAFRTAHEDPSNDPFVYMPRSVSVRPPVPPRPSVPSLRCFEPRCYNHGRRV